MIKQLLNLAFVSSEELWRSLRVLSAEAEQTLDLHNSSADTQPHPIIVNYAMGYKYGQCTRQIKFKSELIFSFQEDKEL